jgi:putative membrane protein
MEVKVGQLAQGKATSAPAKSYADMLVTDHKAHLTEVQTTAKNANLTLMDDAAVMAELKKMKPDQPDPIAVLQPLTGDQFDKRFGELMAQGHRDVIKMCEDAQGKVTNADVKALLAKTLPTLRHHAEMADQIAGTKPASNP